MYELIIFTMMAPNVEPMWLHLEPTSESVCIESKQVWDEMFALTDGLVFSVTCEPVEKDDD